MTTTAKRVLAGVVLAAVTLTGCSGIPTAGAPVEGELIDEQIELPIGDAPEGPREGATQEEILVEFISAATNPQENFAIARQFLTQEFETEWDPENIVRLATGAGTSRAVDESRLRFDYEFNTRASVTSEGRYLEQPEADTATLRFSFVEERGEWRISEAPPGIVISEDRFDNVFTPQPLYFFDPSFRFLVPDVRWFPKQPRAATRAVEALLAGPSDWLANGVISSFPAGTALGQDLVAVNSGVATVDLTEEARASNNVARDRMRQQLSTSLAAVSGNVSSVVITIGGTPLSLPQPTSSAAIFSPEVGELPLVGREGDFGFASKAKIAPIEVLSARVQDLDARAATLARGQSSAAVLRGGGGVYLVTSDDSDEEAVLIDRRPRLIPPSIDNAGWVWTVPRDNGGAIRVGNSDGQAQAISSSLPRGTQIMSLDVSRDGSRVLLYFMADGGPRLAVAGITRQEGMPTALGELELLPVPSGVPVDATWVDEITVATLSRSGASTAVTATTIGGPSESLGELTGGQTIVGGNDGTVGLTVLTGDGELFRSRATVWQKTGISASFLATQQ